MATVKIEYAVQWMYETSVGGWITRKMNSHAEAVSGSNLIQELDGLESRAVSRVKRKWYQFPAEWVEVAS